MTFQWNKAVHQSTINNKLWCDYLQYSVDNASHQLQILTSLSDGDTDKICYTGSTGSPVYRDPPCFLRKILHLDIVKQHSVPWAAHWRALPHPPAVCQQPWSQPKCFNAYNGSRHSYPWLTAAASTVKYSQIIHGPTRPWQPCHVRVTCSTPQDALWSPRFQFTSISYVLIRGVSFENCGDDGFGINTGIEMRNIFNSIQFYNVSFTNFDSASIEAVGSTQIQVKDISFCQGRRFGVGPASEFSIENLLFQQKLSICTTSVKNHQSHRYEESIL